MATGFSCHTLYECEWHDVQWQATIADRPGRVQRRGWSNETPGRDAAGLERLRLSR